MAYPTEQRPLSSQIWTEKSKWDHWQTWARYDEIEDVNDLHIEWHFPSQAEIKAVQETILIELREPLEFLNSFRNKNIEMEF
eukprot:TRINITY_DN2294_c0_g1_i1.p2 TRINITY_DN2294_c0_g1~~TRINITY_DN2294_c0_g1_i1.p2  ORF type:complete len:82 (+),score=9.70 TRINITY_DN2294_c0_g1_i1:178-423(+)